ncbi:electron transport complex subunit RsxB [Pseudomonas sp. LP_7_YM]|uniref:electron transport complex subunit RsxB n=1 Tax=Pseudomonas sp. LP_7_YM TaxID=2485137 RepID=UPI00105C2209|nr:electron transport complex subunit RsxB [Pseudomonas sp. LP_7_YM]TDV70167.1 electron transport complex protein RnfB [Pseudomonas sp. LP_7_YM]
MNLIERIDALLPQTQCGKCGHPGCKPYAEGIASGEAINKCPPGGDETIAALSQLLNVSVIALDTGRGSAAAQVAFIREAECIGCTKCIQACPVDAILGAAKLMHTVITDECTGCDLCVAPCPVDCIDMRLLSSPHVVPLVGGLAFDEIQRGLRAARRGRARQRFEARNARLWRQEKQRQAERMLRERKPETPAAAKVNTIQAALERSRSEAAVNSDAALKQARTHVAMSRAQLNKSLKAFGHPPIAQQAARLAVLQKEHDEAERALEALLEGATANLLSREKTMANDAAISAPDKAALNRAKIQLAMRRAALKKAQTAESPLEQIATLSDEVNDAEQALKRLEARDSRASHLA